MKTKITTLITLFLIFTSIVNADNFDPNQVYKKGDKVTITFNNVEILIEYNNDMPSNTLNQPIPTPYDANNGWIWSISRDYTGQWVPYHYVLFPDKPTTVTFSGFTYQLKQEAWAGTDNPSAATWAWTCLNCGVPVKTCSNNITTDYFPIALAKQNNGNDNTNFPNASGGATIITGLDGNFLNINEMRNCNTPLALYNNDIYFRDACDPHAGLGYYGIADNTNVTAPKKRLFADNDTDGPVLYGWKGGALGIRQRKDLTATNGAHIEKIALQWTPSDVILGTKLLPMNLKTYGPIRSYLSGNNKLGLSFEAIEGATILSVYNTTSQATTFKLYSNGVMKTKNIWAESIDVVSPMTWPDYVFKKEYSLMPLSEVEAFVQKNNHLPNVASEAEVKEKGINLAEMDATLLRKVEELTLYIIQQQKQIESMQKELQSLKK